MRNHTGAVTATANSPATSPGSFSDNPASTLTRLPETGFLRQPQPQPQPQPQVLVFVPISKSTLWRRIQVGTFPVPVKLSARVAAWRAEDVRQWIAEQGAD